MKSEPLPGKAQELAYEYKVRDAMSSELMSVSRGDTMAVVRRILHEKRISGLPVVENDHLIGVVSIDNFINSLLQGGIENTVEGNMTMEVDTLFADEPLIHAVIKFEEFGFGRFPVLERDTGKLVGIVTKGDIIRCLLKKLEISYQKDELRRYRASHIFKDIKSDKTTLILKYSINGGSYSSAGEQSGYLKINLKRLGIPPKVVRRTIVACCEAEMNIIIFTEGGELTVCVEEDRIRVNAIDDGPGIADIEKAMTPGFSTASDWIREMGFGAGMGLPNIKNCSDEMHIDSEPAKGTNLEFVILFKGGK